MAIHYYECTGCGKRLLTANSRAACPDCGKDLQNIAVPRE